MQVARLPEVAARAAKRLRPASQLAARWQSGQSYRRRGHEFTAPDAQEAGFFASGPAEKQRLSRLPQAAADRVTLRRLAAEKPEDFITDVQEMPIHSLEADPYGWAPTERDVKEAPLWMVYEQMRQERPLPKAKEGVGKRIPEEPIEIKAPMRDAQGRAFASGARKSARAQVWVKEGDGNFIINDRSLADYFPTLGARKLAMEPLLVTQTCGAFDVWLRVKGGGPSGQAGAIRHALAHALGRYDPYLKPILGRFRMLKRDPREVERKKPGQKKARKKFQWIKR